MAGPTSSILLKSIPTKLEWKKITNAIKTISKKVEDEDFWVISTEAIGGKSIATEGRPFGLSKSEFNPKYYSEDEIYQIEKSIDFRPKCDIEIYAMSKSTLDHRILGELTLYVAEQLDGIIDFNGDLNCGKLTGCKWDILYEISESKTGKYTVCDVTFMKAWLANDNFYMIK